MKWYEKYLNAYNRPFQDLPEETVENIRSQLARIQSKNPVVSVVVIAHNEERNLAACLWSLSEMQTKYPIEILGVNNLSTDNTEAVYKTLGVPYWNEEKKGPGFARQCGLDNSRGKYHFFIDADTMYPPQYVNLLMRKLEKKGVACVGTFWSFYPDSNHSSASLWIFETIRDIFLWLQHFNRPELCIRGMTFSFNADYARQVKIRTDIIRGEDGSLALSLKKFGKIAFVYSRKCRPVTGYGTLGNESIAKKLWERVKVQGKGISRLFYKTEHYIDTEDNLIQKKSSKNET